MRNLSNKNMQPTHEGQLACRIILSSIVRWALKPSCKVGSVAKLHHIRTR